MGNNVFLNTSIPLIDLGEGVSRKVLCHNDQMMMVEVHFKKGSIGSVHRHVHTQCTYVLSGSFRFSINSVEQIVSQGDSLVFESNILHGTVCLEDGVLLDVFTPQREDFLR